MPESCSLTITCLDGWDGQIDEDGRGHTHTHNCLLKVSSLTITCLDGDTRTQNTLFKI